MPSTFEALQKKRELVLRLVWLALLLCMVFYSFPIWIPVQVSLFQPSDNAAIVIILILAISGWQVRRQFLSEARLRAHLSKPLYEVEYQTRGIQPPVSQDLDTLSEAQRRLLTIPSWMQPSLLINWAINDAIALCGLFLLLNQEIQGGLSVMGIAAVLQILAYPRFEEYYAMAKRLMP